MPRQSRLVLPGCALHVIQRGNNRQACFRRDGDYLLYLLHLRELAAKHDCSVHAYCLMTNHVHLLMTPCTANALSTLMQRLGQRYVQYVNRTYGRTGTLWEGRFRSCVAESAKYVLACYRYIELNPVRAGMVDRPGGHPWSSYAANAEGRDDRLVTPHAEYLGLGSDCESQRRAYRNLVDEPLQADLLARIREATNGGYPLDGKSLISVATLRPGQKLERGRPGRPRNKDEGDRDPSMEIGL